MKEPEGSDPPGSMLRIRGDRRSLLAALAAEWAERQLQLPIPNCRPSQRLGRPVRPR